MQWQALTSLSRKIYFLFFCCFFLSQVVTMIERTIKWCADFLIFFASFFLFVGHWHGGHSWYLPQPLNDDTKILTETDTETFFPITTFPKPILFFWDQILRNRNKNPQNIGKSFEMSISGCQSFRLECQSVYWNSPSHKDCGGQEGLHAIKVIYICTTGSKDHSVIRVNIQVIRFY